MSINIIFLVGQAKIFNADRKKCLTPHPVVCSASCKIISWNVFPNLLSLLRDKELKIEQVTCFTVSVTEDILKLGTLMSNKCHKAFTWTLFTIRNRNIDIWNESKTLWNLNIDHLFTQTNIFPEWLCYFSLRDLSSEECAVQYNL